MARLIREERQDGRQLFSAARVQSTSGVLSFTGYDTGTRPYLRCGSHSHPGLFAHPVGRKWTGRQLSRPVRLHQAPFPLDGDGCIWRLVREVAFLRLSHSTLTTHLGTYTHPPDRALRCFVSSSPAWALLVHCDRAVSFPPPCLVHSVSDFFERSNIIQPCCLCAPLKYADAGVLSSDRGFFYLRHAPLCAAIITLLDRAVLCHSSLFFGEIQMWRPWHSDFAPYRPQNGMQASAGSRTTGIQSFVFPGAETPR